MGRYLLTGAAALALMSGVAMAQTAPYGTSSTTVITPGPAIAPAAPAYRQTMTKQSTDDDGTKTTRTRSYEGSAAGGTETRTKTSVDPDSGNTVTRSKTVETTR